MKLLHRTLWQRLPRSFRREALFLTTAMVAPRPERFTRPVHPIVVAGVLRSASGLGQSARLCHDALRASGLPVYGLDLTAELMQPIDHPDFDFADGRRLESGTLLLHVNAPLVPLALWRLGRSRVRHAYVVGYWAWELPEMPADWRHGIPFVHEVWTPSRFTADAVRTIAAGLPVLVIPHAIAIGHRSEDHPPTSASHPHGPSPCRPFTVLTLFNAASSVARKNPLAVVAAFRRAFGDDPTTRLVVKTSNAGAFVAEIAEAIGRAGNITLIDQVASAAEIDALYGDADVVVSLHRSEGFGLILAEGMLRGRPVVATDWSGNTDFLTAETGFPVPFRLVPAVDPQGTYHFPVMHWAEADVDAAADILRRLRADPDLGRRVGRRAADFAQASWGAEVYAGHVRSALGL